MKLENSKKRGHERYSLERLNALTDGVVAIAITLLVLGIDIPEDHDFTEEGLKLFLLKLEPGLIAYLTSFVVIAVYWNIHHRIFSVVKFYNSTIGILNILFLLTISLLPFVSKIKSLYRYDWLTVLVYGFTHIITGLILLTTWQYFMRHKDLLRVSVNDTKSRLVSWSILMIPVVSVVAILLSYINIHIGTYLFLLIPLLYMYFFNLSKPLFEEGD